MGMKFILPFFCWGESIDSQVKVIVKQVFLNVGKGVLSMFFFFFWGGGWVFLYMTDHDGYVRCYHL